MGCKVEVFEGVCFKKGVPLRDFVSDMYQRRIEASSAEGTLLKLKMNSLYSKFAVRGDLSKTKTMSLEEFNQISSTHTIQNFMHHFDGTVCVTYSELPYYATDSESMNSVIKTK